MKIIPWPQGEEKQRELAVWAEIQSQGPSGKGEMEKAQNTWGAVQHFPGSSSRPWVPPEAVRGGVGRTPRAPGNKESGIRRRCHRQSLKEWVLGDEALISEEAGTARPAEDT